ncbi:MAG: asparagine synthase (glutamine-hydrolyzing) [Bdellovibrionales bacterium]|nr:asparagine synthase (glutamine-hydrolyzing) [Bdellovibrionales bacterium]
MCGIAAVIALDSNSHLSRNSIESMVSGLVHRGPDDEGYFFHSSILLGHRRLSIIDVDRGQQPMSTPDGRYTLVINGEIFNYKSIRQELIDCGEEFRSSSDTEVFLLGFKHWGVSIFQKMQGMFAGILFDSQISMTYVFRDSFGIKPLYWLRDKNRIYIASEIKSIQKGISRKLQLDHTQIPAYFLMGYVPFGQTLFKGIKKIEPGELISISSKGTITTRSFSRDLDPSTLSQSKTSDVSSLRSCLISAVERSLVSDVPVGLYLSGGIDSSLIAAITKRELGRDLQAFSVSFPSDPQFDESITAKRVAQHLDINLTEINVIPDDCRNFRLLARTLEEPMMDPSALALMKLSHETRKEVKVTLSGEGGDELFSGYHRYYWDQLVSLFRAYPNKLQQLTLLIAEKIPRLASRVRRYNDIIDMPRFQRYFHLFSGFSSDELKKIYKHDPKEAMSLSTHFENLFDDSADLSSQYQMQWIDLVTFLRDDLLIKADKMSMINGLEVRVPYLQTDVVRMAFGFKPKEHLNWYKDKKLLRKQLSAYVPEDIAYRKKQGFEFPLDHWFRTSWRGSVESYLSKDATLHRPWLDTSVIEKIKHDHFALGKNRGRALFSLILLEAWTQEFID